MVDKLSAVRYFCESKNWVTDDLINEDFTWSEGFIIICSSKRIVVEIDIHDIFHIQILEKDSQAVKEYSYNTTAQIKQALTWIVR
jgi:hypothetical protein